MQIIKTIEQFNVNQLRSLLALYDYHNKYCVHEEEIEEVGYNMMSGYVFIAFDSGYQLVIFEGRTEEKDVILFTLHPVTGEEIEFDNVGLYIEWLDEQSERIHNSY